MLEKTHKAPSSGPSVHQSLRGEDTYKVGWSTQVSRSPSEQRNHEVNKRCLVGSFPDNDEITTEMKWGNGLNRHGKSQTSRSMTWMESNSFSKLQGSSRAHLTWKVDKTGKDLRMNWWSPLAELTLLTKSLTGFGYKVLVSQCIYGQDNTMKELGDKFGGWIATEEETSLKNHLWWAYLKVKRPYGQIPREVEIPDGDFIFTMPVWVEALARFKLKDGSGVKTSISVLGMKVVGCAFLTSEIWWRPVEF